MNGLEARAMRIPDQVVLLADQLGDGRWDCEPRPKSRPPRRPEVNPSGGDGPSWGTAWPQPL